MEEILKEITSTQNLIMISMAAILIHLFFYNIRITDKLTDIEQELQKTNNKLNNIKQTAKRKPIQQYYKNHFKNTKPLLTL